MQWLKQSTAFTETIGPILDSTGAEYAGAVIGDLSISKNGTEAAMAAAATLTHISNGHYTLVGTTGNSDTLGRVTIRCNKSTYQGPVKEYMVLPATVYDALVTNAAGGANGLVLSLANNGVNVTQYTGIADTPILASGTLVSAPTGSTAVLQTALGADDLANGCLFKVVSGTGAGQTAIIVDYVNSTKTVTFDNAPIVALDNTSVYRIIYEHSGRTTLEGFFQADVQLWRGSVPATLSANSNVKADLRDINGTTIAGTGTRIADAFVIAFNVAAPVWTAESVKQTGDSYSRIGAAGAGLTALGDTRIANLDATVSSRLATSGYTAPDNTTIGLIAGYTDSIESRLPAALVGGRMDSSAGALASGLDFTATMKTSLSAATPAVTVSDKTGFALTSAYDFAKGTVAVTEAYAANGAAPTPIQAMMAIHQMLMQFSIASTNYTVKKLDNATTAFVVTLSDATSPTGATRT